MGPCRKFNLVTEYCSSPSSRRLLKSHIGYFWLLQWKSSLASNFQLKFEFYQCILLHESNWNYFNLIKKNCLYFDAWISKIFKNFLGRGYYNTVNVFATVLLFLVSPEACQPIFQPVILLSLVPGLIAPMVHWIKDVFSFKVVPGGAHYQTLQAVVPYMPVPSKLFTITVLDLYHSGHGMICAF